LSFRTDQHFSQGRYGLQPRSAGHPSPSVSGHAALLGGFLEQSSTEVPF
jgi:hypothetical protein